MNPALLQQLTFAGLIAIMLSMGLKVTFAEVIASVRKPRLVLLALAANFVLQSGAKRANERATPDRPLPAAGLHTYSLRVRSLKTEKTYRDV